MKTRLAKFAYFVMPVVLILGITIFSFQDNSAQAQNTNAGGTRCTPLSTSGVTRTHHGRRRNRNANGNMNSNTGGNMNANNGNGNSPSR